MTDAGSPLAQHTLFRFHELRHALLAESHARPSTPLAVPTLATRIAALSGPGGIERDLAHMVALCRRLGTPEPSPGARWSVLDAGRWRLRWERHTELSTWTFFRPLPEDFVPRRETALDLAPQDWLAELPGDVLVATHVTLLRARPAADAPSEEDEIATDVADGAAQVFTDLRAGPDAFTRFLVVQPQADGPLAGRIVQQLMEIEQYRLMALFAFPVAQATGVKLARLEAEAEAAARMVAEEGGLEADRALIERLARLAGEAQALAGSTSFRFSAARAYYGIVLERIQQLREKRRDGRLTIAEFMERRLAPAMRTCAAVADRQQSVIQHIARTSQLLATRVSVASERTNAGLLASMDQRARLQLRLQQTVEGLSVAAIAYYALGLLAYVFKAVKGVSPGFDDALATGIAAPVVIAVVWLALRRMRQRLMDDEAATRR